MKRIVIILVISAIVLGLTSALCPKHRTFSRLSVVHVARQRHGCTGTGAIATGSGQQQLFANFALTSDYKNNNNINKSPLATFLSAGKVLIASTYATIVRFFLHSWLTAQKILGIAPKKADFFPPAPNSSNTLTDSSSSSSSSSSLSSSKAMKMNSASSSSSQSFEDYFNRPGPWDNKDLEPLFDANRHWVRSLEKDNPEFFEQQRKGHAPKILWIGCSDARVPANQIIGEPAGSVFVHRNIANMVVNTDFNCMSVIQYAVDVLKVKHIIVCGHYDCGGVRAALEQKDHRSPLENWLRNIRDTYRLHRHELLEIPDLYARHKRLVELNVIEQCLNVYKTAVVQRRRVETYQQLNNVTAMTDANIQFSEPRVHAFVYEPSTGVMQRLPVDFKKILSDLGEVYDLYRPTAA